jgi:repressor of nif and glnA expression
MPYVIVRCPKCGHRFVVEVPREREKGEGAHYAEKIRKLSPLHIEILQILAEKGSLTKARIGGILAERGRRVSGNSLSGRLSELAGLGYVECKYTRVKLYDAKRMVFRFVKKPVWEITELGRRVLGEELKKSS